MDTMTDPRTDAEIIDDEGCAGCRVLAARVVAIENEMREAREQGQALMAKMPKPMRRMLGLEPD